MKAIVKATAAPGLEMVEVPEPQPGRDDVLIKVRKASICGTDVHIDIWDEWARQTLHPPLIIGHEFVGEVVSVPSGDHDFKVGDIVTGEGHIVCGHCRNCLAGRRHLCRETQGVGVQRDGAFAEYVTFPVWNVWKADPALDEELYSCFDPLGNAVHTALTYDLVGEDVLITGAGPIGCMGAAVSWHGGARHVVVTDNNPYRLELAKKLGATRVVNIREESLRDVMKELGMREGFDVGLEMSGNPAALDTQIDLANHGGKLALLGILPRQTAVDWNKVIFKALTLTGIYGRKMYDTWYKTTAMIKSGLKIEPIITHRFPMNDYREAFELMKSGQSGKIVLTWE